MHAEAASRADKNARVASLRQRSVAAMNVERDQRVLDVGSGTGTGTFALAEIVGASGIVRGVDYDISMVIEAQRRAAEHGVDAWVSFHQANAAALPWPDGYFDASRSDCVLQHMLDPIRGFGELVRVTRSGGRVVVVDGDWATLNRNADDAEIEGQRAYFQETFRRATPVSGQCLFQLFERQGMQDVAIDVQPVFDANADVNGCWLQSRTQAAEHDGSFASANVVMICGRKP